jgi:uncharacterized protein
MKILIASDIHGDRKKIEKLVEKSEKEKAELVILCGDLTYSESDTTGLIGPFKKSGAKIIILPGNHESNATTDFLAEQYAPGVYNLHLRAMSFYNEIGIFGCGLAQIGLFNIDDDEVIRGLRKAHKPIEKDKFQILITHMPPYNTKLDQLWHPVGSPGIRKIIEEFQPDVCFCGHIHETFGMKDKIGKTQIFNVGPDGIVIDVKKKGT